MEFSAQQIAAVLGGALYGNANAKVSDVAPIEQAQAQHLTFITDEKYLPYLENRRRCFLPNAVLSNRRS